MQCIQRHDTISQIVQHTTEDMVLEVLSNAFVVDLAVDANGFEDLGVANARQLQELWALNGAGR